MTNGRIQRPQSLLHRPDGSLTENLPSSYHGHLRLKVTTFNVNTLRHVGSTELLRKQCHQAGIHVLGLQETRATCDVT